MMHNMEYLVKWVGFPDSDNTWLPHAELRDNEYLHAYLREHGLAHLIPRRHRGKRNSKKDLVQHLNSQNVERVTVSRFSIDDSDRFS